MGIEGLSIAFDGLGQEVVQGIQDIARLRVVARHKLFGLRLVTAPAVLRCHDGSDRLAIVIKRIRVIFVGKMTFDTSNAFDCVRAAFPVIDDAWRRFVMAVDTGL